MKKDSEMRLSINRTLQWYPHLDLINECNEIVELEIKTETSLLEREYEQELRNRFYEDDLFEMNENDTFK